ncbi:MAG TPA: iron-sulfur cluster repair di-iron protein [Microthrixaceae bacterium]|jgi:regulator of cell morphogenesis and NO signaling|nr:iron-sulfur cluster repair di-iron protein [Microthrixaceae bacterium]
MTITTDATLASIVDANPDAARILEHHQLDYCCGGQQTLGQACDEHQIDPAAIIAELDAVPPAAADWTTMGPAELVDHLESTHHRYLHEELPRLAALARKVAEVHGERHEELHRVESTFTELKDDLEPHLMKEERVLFPMIRELANATTTPEFHCGSIDNPIRMMRFEHDRAGELLVELRDASNGFQSPDDACGSYQALYRGLEELEADTHLHVHKENNVLFPAVEALEATLAANA